MLEKNNCPNCNRMYHKGYMEGHNKLLKHVEKSLADAFYSRPVVMQVNTALEKVEAQNTIDNKAHDAISRLGTLYLSTHETNRHVIAAVNHFAKWADKQQCCPDCGTDEESL